MDKINNYSHKYPLPNLPPKGKERAAFPPWETGKGVK